MIKFLENNYTLIRGKENFNELEVKPYMTDYFSKYDYILGDYSYGRVRLKGFYESSNKNVKPLNDIKYLDEYISKYCAYGAKIFVLKRNL